LKNEEKERKERKERKKERKKEKRLKMRNGVIAEGKMRGESVEE
jgi:hypothetical protein